MVNSSEAAEPADEVDDLDDGGPSMNTRGAIVRSCDYRSFGCKPMQEMHKSIFEPCSNRSH
jgi:hypothetical protein